MSTAVAPLEVQEATASTSQVPADKIQIRLLLSTGKKADFIFDPSVTVLQVKQHVFDNWPAGLLTIYFSRLIVCSPTFALSLFLYDDRYSIDLSMMIDDV